MKFDHTYIVVKDFDASVEIYASLFDREPDSLEPQQWADWSSDKVYFGLMSKHAYHETGGKGQIGRLPVLAFKSENLEKDLALVQELGLEIATPISKVGNVTYDYSYFEFEDPDGYVIEVACYDN